MSIRWMRTGQVKNSRVLEAIGWSKEICSYIARKYNITVDTWLDTVGTVGTIRWTVELPDMATMDKMMTAVMSDADYWRFVEKAMKAELFIDGIGVDTVMKKF